MRQGGIRTGLIGGEQLRPGARRAVLSRLLVMVALWSIVGCSYQTTGPTTLTDPTLAISAEDSRNLVLAFVAYAGEYLEGEALQRDLAACVARDLAARPETRRYELVWGPATSTVGGERLTDNMMFVVRDTAGGGLVVVIRGTNDASAYDWLVEDLAVASTVPWDFAPAASNVRLSEGTALGLEALLGMKSGRASETPTTLAAFLAAADAGGAPIGVVGHSLGGALAPALALWLSDSGTIRQRPAVHAYAGATPGNAAFARYYDERLGAVTRRLHNPYDVVPLAWSAETLVTIPGLYAPRMDSNWLERFAIFLASTRSRSHDYAQITPGAPSLPATLQPDAASFEAQLVWQHRCGYVCALGLSDMPAVSRSCGEPTEEPECSCP